MQISHNKIRFILTGLLAGLLIIAGTAVAADVPTMTKEDLKTILSDTNLLIFDARRGGDWTASEFKIKGAVRAAPDEVESWAGNFSPDKKVVIYCA